MRKEGKERAESEFCKRYGGPCLLLGKQALTKKEKICFFCPTAHVPFGPRLSRPPDVVIEIMVTWATGYQKRIPTIISTSQISLILK